MTEYCLRPEIVAGLLDEVSRHRVLTDPESEMLEEIIAMDTTPFRWNPRLENQLLIAASSPGGIRRFADRIGVNHRTAIVKLHRMRKRNIRKGAVVAVKV